jgi:Tol biopolymer transport system component
VAIGATASLLGFTPVAGGAVAAAPASSAQIAYIGKYMGTPALYLANSDGSDRQLLAPDVVDHTTFSWSPDGVRIAFTRGPEGKAEIYVVNADGSGLKQLTHSSGKRKRTPSDYSVNPSWSPDGETIAFNGQRAYSAGSGDQTFLIHADGTGERQLTRAQAPEWVPAWSPDGRTILFEHWDGRWGARYWVHNGQIDLYTVNADGSGRRRVAHIRNERGNCACATWSPDGTKIAYEAAGANGKPDIYVMNADGSGQTRLTRSPSRDENPDWSPDGTQLAFYSERSGNAQIYVMNADGTEQRRVTHDPWYDQAVRWRPAG